MPNEWDGIHAGMLHMAESRWVYGGWGWVCRCGWMCDGCATQEEARREGDKHLANSNKEETTDG
jgi:hypothetical protein